MDVFWFDESFDIRRFNIKDSLFVAVFSLDKCSKAYGPNFNDLLFVALSSSSKFLDRSENSETPSSDSGLQSAVSSSDKYFEAHDPGLPFVTFFG